MGAILLVGILSGCLGTPSIPEGPTEGPSHVVSVEAPKRPVLHVVPAAFNWTRCQGIGAHVELPASLLQGRVPQPFSVVEFGPGTSVLFQEFVRCEKVAVEGRDTGAATLGMAFVAVRAPADWVPGDRGALFLLEARTNRSDLLSHLALPAAKTHLALRYELSPLTPGYGRLSAQVATDARTLYELEASQGPAFEERSVKYRLFWDDANESYYDLDGRQIDSRGNGRGVLTAAPGTLVSEILRGAPAAPALTAVFEASNQQWFSPAGRR